ncbi:AAA family ATPase [Faecalicatena contorta]|uniref:Cytidylate kinase n=1 Tax=Faecalicatena contorta TaxID=39482 RepID=A0A315ZR62_9FIRM|nr:cytidylate kinase-like family protein [Faecalicatena contorta]PWJ47348.1 cytidylate kinase [Faecalicatena contorta]SUQ16062.1 Cytidylate kinase [Faecalicatena contorta]
MEHLIITVARGFGSGGKSIANQVAEDLGINCYENQILTLASQISGIDENILVETNEKIRGKSYVHSLLHNLPRTLMPRVEGEFQSDKNIFQIQKQIIEKLAATESCIIVGKCADWILRDRPNVISIYIEAPRAYCRQKIMDRMNVNEAVADKSITQTDKYRAEYYKHYTGGNYWTNPVNYDLTLNSARVGFDNCVKTIETYIQIKYPGFEMKPAKEK